jgi:hypothetical protein
MSRFERTIFTAMGLCGLATCENHTIPKTDFTESIEAGPTIADFFERHLGNQTFAGNKETRSDSGGDSR